MQRQLQSKQSVSPHGYLMRMWRTIRGTILSNCSWKASCCCLSFVFSKALILNPGCTLISPGQLKNTRAWALPIGCCTSVCLGWGPIGNFSNLFSTSNLGQGSQGSPTSSMSTTSRLLRNTHSGPHPRPTASESLYTAQPSRFQQNL